MAQLRFTELSKTDLHNIYDYIKYELLNEKAANQTVDGIIDEIKKLRTFPKMGAKYEIALLDSTNYRFIVVHGYTVYYYIDGDTVNIVRVLYKRRNAENVTMQ